MKEKDNRKQLVYIALAILISGFLITGGLFLTSNCNDKEPKKVQEIWNYNLNNLFPMSTLISIDKEEVKILDWFCTPSIEVKDYDCGGCSFWMELKPKEDSGSCAVLIEKEVS